MATESTRSDENPLTDEDLRQLLNGLLWYHTIDVRPGVTTKGWFDLRHALPLIPWPTITGRRCLDIGTWDGFYAFELERRGAAEVIALDVPDLLDIDFPPAVRGAANFDPEPAGKQRRSAGFHLLHEQLGSKVQWKGVNIYDVAQAGLGRFDVVVIGSLLVHLRDPVRALDAVRRVTDGYLVLIEFVHWPLEAVASRRPVAQLGAISEDFQWWLPSSSALRNMLTASGFEIVDESRPFLLREPDQPRPPNPSGRVRHAIGTAAKQVMTRDWGWHGHMHRAFLARPRSTSDA